MPRTHLDKFSRKRPPADYPKALILERVAALDISPDDIAAALGVSRNTWFTRLKQPTTSWPFGQLIAACKILGVEPEDLRQAIRYKV